MSESTLQDSALSYLGRHWSVIPVLAGDKRPALRWQEFQYLRAESGEVKEWFERWPDANIGIVTGAISGLVVLDVDPKHRGNDSLAALLKRHGPMPATVEARTGGGGRHFYFAHPGGIVHNKVGLMPGIDLRGDGGYVVAPPSRHASGRRYAWTKGHSPEEAPLARFPPWLLDRSGVREAPIGHPLKYWRKLVRDGVAEGERNNTVASFCGHLLWHGVDIEVATQLLLCWNAVRCRPPLPDDEVIRTINNIARLHERHAGEEDPAGEGGGPAQKP
ncbi:MAG: bifunctional DNA primase/polymerase [Pseudomonadota bacterium]